MAGIAINDVKLSPSKICKRHFNSLKAGDVKWMTALRKMGLLSMNVDPVGQPSEQHAMELERLENKLRKTLVKGDSLRTTTKHKITTLNLTENFNGFGKMVLTIQTTRNL